MQPVVRAALILLAFAWNMRVAYASAIKINSTCETGSCSNPDVLALESTQSAAFNFVYQFANTDSYHLQGTLSTTNTTKDGFQVAISDFAVTYEGNSTATASGTDTLVADFLQNFANRSRYTATAYEAISGLLGPGLGSASSASGQFLVAGQALPLLGPYTLPGDFSGYYTGNVGIPNGSFLGDYRYTLTFGSGSQVGSSISVNPSTSVTPEPGTFIMVASGALGLLQVARRRAGVV